ncbi:MAG TPA: hypothetical protein VHW23_48090 [Kofleriaceae bacterium]|nr:hypothetical protein [Kofleriaceae bacterium]
MASGGIAPGRGTLIDSAPPAPGERTLTESIQCKAEHAGASDPVKQPRPARLVDAHVSLDWFRVPSGYVPGGVAADDWLALCEVNFRARERPRAGSVFARLEGTFHRLLFRTELGRPRLYRAVLA